MRNSKEDPTRDASTTFNGAVNALHQLNTEKRQNEANSADDNDARVEVGDDRRFHPSRSMTSLAFFETLSSATSRRTISTGRKKRYGTSLLGRGSSIF